MRFGRSVLTTLLLLATIAVLAPTPATADGPAAHRRHATRIVGWGPVAARGVLGSTITRRIHVSGPGDRAVVVDSAMAGRVVARIAARTNRAGFLTVVIRVEHARAYFRVRVAGSAHYRGAHTPWLRVTQATPQPTPGPTPTPDPTPSPTTTPTPTPTSSAVPGAIDTSNRDAVLSAYQNLFKPTTWQVVEWNGDEATCNAGGVTPHFMNQVIVAVNYFRAMAGVPPVTLDAALSASAQQSALIMDANRRLSHFPTADWKCWNQEGSDASARSNLWITWATSGPDPKATAGGPIADYMDDTGVDSVGHRSWVVYPYSTVMGVGATQHAESLNHGVPPRSGATPPTYMTWPTAGYFPSALVPQDFWSIAATKEKSLAGASVSVVGPDGVAVPVSGIHDGYVINGPTLVWTVHLPKPTADTTYTVHVTGPIDVTYKVTIVPVG